MSARRRPSVTNLLDAIPEVNTHSSKNSPGVGEDIILPYDDISEVVCSSFDAKYPAKNIFKFQPSSSASSLSSPTHPAFPHHHQSPGGATSPAHHHFGTLSRGNSKSLLNITPSKKNNPNPHSMTSAGLWMSTGMLPQFIVVTFYEKWLIKKVS